MASARERAARNAATMPAAAVIVRNALVATCDAGTADAGLIPDGAVAISNGRVAWVGRGADLQGHVRCEGAEIVDCGGRLVTPGLVDSHTHLVFAGDRAADVALRSAGKTYGDIARLGGGITATVRATRAASEETLLRDALRRARRLLAAGVTTLEVKSGYGLTVRDELRLLRVIRKLGRAIADEMTVVPTLLAAHAVPPELSRARWVGAICEDLLPAVAGEGLAQFQDAFVEEGAFTLAQARRVLEVGARMGLVPRLHADQLSAGGGARLAADLGCASADHLDHADDDGVAALASAAVVAGLLPTSTLFLGLRRFAPARRLLDAGAVVALATNVNPGSAPTESTALTFGLACAQLQMSPAEALVAFTAGGARALRQSDAGRLAAGCQADLVVWGCRSVEHLPWHFGVNHALRVMKRGRFVHSDASRTKADCH